MDPLKEIRIILDHIPLTGRQAGKARKKAASCISERDAVKKAGL